MIIKVWNCKKHMRPTYIFFRHVWKQYFKVELRLQWYNTYSNISFLYGGYLNSFVNFSNSSLMIFKALHVKYFTMCRVLLESCMCNTFSFLRLIIEQHLANRYLCRAWIAVCACACICVVICVGLHADCISKFKDKYNFSHYTAHLSGKILD